MPDVREFVASLARQRGDDECMAFARADDALSGLACQGYELVLRPVSVSDGQREPANGGIGPVSADDQRG